MQCGEFGTPEPATGVDVDGEPACNLHRVRTDSIFVKPKVVDSGAPSPLQTTEQGKADMAEKVCVGFGSRVGNCGEVLNRLNTSGLCKKCYANKDYHDRHPRKPGAKIRKTATSEAPLTSVGEALLNQGIEGSAGSTPDPGINVYISAPNVSRLLNLLLAQ